MENTEKLVEKIQKLLAKAAEGSGATENEVITATLKAQKLMAEHNISMSEVCRDTKKLDVKYMMAKTKGYRDFRKALAVIIAENFRCKTVLMENRDVVFMGILDDVNVAVETFNYLYEFIVSEGNKRYNKAIRKGEASGDIFNSYAVGFLMGLKRALDKQCRALMVLIPKEVEDEFDSLNTVKGKGYQPPETIHPESFQEGHHDGTTILNGKRLV